MMLIHAIGNSTSVETLVEKYAVFERLGRLTGKLHQCKLQKSYSCPT